jgi:uncharacterized protein involved in propanediol utilization
MGYGKSFASFGEIVQGRLLNDEDFLITLPIDLWATCKIERELFDGPSMVECEFEKSKRVAYKTLESLGKLEGEKLTITFTRNIPIGKGLSSSTADMLAVVRALQEIYGFLATESYISSMFRRIEPHDALHYYMSVVYNHRSGELINKLNYIPQYSVLMIDFGGIKNTEEYNLNLMFTLQEKSDYELLYKKSVIAFMKQDDREIAQCATESTFIHFSKNDKEVLLKIKELLVSARPLGVIATHSGTCIGLLYSQQDFITDSIQKLVFKIFPNAELTVQKTIQLL